MARNKRSTRTTEKAYVVEVLDLVAQVHIARAAAALQVERARDVALQSGDSGVKERRVRPVTGMDNSARLRQADIKKELSSQTLNFVLTEAGVNRALEVQGN
jgi:hypothetical protein